MAGKIKPMSQVKQLLPLYKDGRGCKEIARSLKMSKNTVKTYLAKLQSLNLNIDYSGDSAPLFRRNQRHLKVGGVVKKN